MVNVHVWLMFMCGLFTPTGPEMYNNTSLQIITNVHLQFFKWQFKFLQQKVTI